MLALLAGCAAAASSETSTPSASLPSIPLEVSLDQGALALRWRLPPEATRVRLEVVAPGDTAWTPLRDGPGISGLREPAPDGLRWVRLRWSDGETWSAWSAARVDPGGEPLGAPYVPGLRWDTTCSTLDWRWTELRPPSSAFAVLDGAPLAPTSVFEAEACDLPTDETATLVVRPWDDALAVDPFPFDSLAQPDAPLMPIPRWPVHGLHTEGATPTHRWVLEPGEARVELVPPEGVSGATLCLQPQEPDGRWNPEQVCPLWALPETLRVPHPGTWRLTLHPGDGSHRPVEDPVTVPLDLFEGLTVRMIHAWPTRNDTVNGGYATHGAGRWSPERVGVQVGWWAPLPVEARIERSLDGETWMMVRDFDGVFTDGHRWLDATPGLDPYRPVHYRVVGRLTDGTLLQASAPYTVPAADTPAALPRRFTASWAPGGAQATLSWAGLDPEATVRLQRCRAWTDEAEAALLASLQGPRLLGTSPERLRGRWRSSSQWPDEGIPEQGCAAPPDWDSGPVPASAQQVVDLTPSRTHFMMYCLESRNHRGEPAEGDFCVLLVPTERPTPLEAPKLCPPIRKEGAEVTLWMLRDRPEMGAEVQRSADGGATWTDLAVDPLRCQKASCTAVDPEAPADRRLLYRARTVSAAGATSPWADPTALGPSGVPVAAPVFEAARWDAEAGGVELRWRFPEGVNQWRVERRPGDAPWSEAEVLWAKAWFPGEMCVSHRVDRDVAPGETWHYRVVARGVDGTAVASAEVAITIPEAPPDPAG